MRTGPIVDEFRLGGNCAAFPGPPHIRDEQHAETLGAYRAHVARLLRLVLGRDDEKIFGPAGAPSDPTPWAGDENATATINYTSGTTARPKGVQQTHRATWLNATVFALHAGLSDRDVYLHTLPMFHANGWGMPFAATGVGIKHVVLRKIDGAEILRRVRDQGVTIMCAAPAVVTAALDAFLAGRIGFLDMAALVEHVMERLGPEAARSGAGYGPSYSPNQQWIIAFIVIGLLYASAIIAVPWGRVGARLTVGLAAGMMIAGYLIVHAWTMKYGS